ncbi:DUF3784 domain-containing protein (plasmid) [Niallia sp. XMNu-256]|uniref:DUF3784 domain-containing protein n=1 Tax=Niallia sp. XMNu-256 TaxID=3082444 RepID=UPI0030CB115A
MTLNTDFNTALIISIIVGALFIITGWLIWKKQKRNLIAGYKESEFKGDKDKLSKDMGIYSIIIGVLVLLFPLVIKYLGEWATWVLVGIIVLITILTLFKINFNNKG